MRRPEKILPSEYAMVIPPQFSLQSKILRQATSQSLNSEQDFSKQPECPVVFLRKRGVVL